MRSTPTKAHSAPVSTTQSTTLTSRLFMAVFVIQSPCAASPRRLHSMPECYLGRTVPDKSRKVFPAFLGIAWKKVQHRIRRRLRDTINNLKTWHLLSEELVVSAMLTRCLFDAKKEPYSHNQK